MPDRNHPDHWTHYNGPYEWLYRPLWWHKAGLSETASGYGRKLTSPFKVRLANGSERRVYVTCYSNAGTAWIVVDNVIRLVDDCMHRKAADYHEGTAP